VIHEDSPSLHAPRNLSRMGGESRCLSSHEYRCLPAWATPLGNAKTR
jgi:hypothetical protein